MGIDLMAEELLTLDQAAEVLPCLRGGRRIHRSTLYRWIGSGVRGVRLESIRLGGSRLTSKEALHRFAERQSRADSCPAAPAPTRASLAAERKLARHGI